MPGVREGVGLEFAAGVRVLEFLGEEVGEGEGFAASVGLGEGVLSAVGRGVT